MSLKDEFRRLSRFEPIRAVAKKKYTSKHFDIEPRIEMGYDEALHILKDIYSIKKSKCYWDEGQFTVRTSYEYELSIIIPFYKTQRFARKCIESVLQQKTSVKYEVLLVDDGSPDNCGKILDEYNSFSNVTVIHQKNQGLSAARNVAILASRGEYIMFIDSDDYVSDHAVDALMKAARSEGADIVEGAFTTTLSNGFPIKRHNRQYLASNNSNGMYGYAWGKVFKRTIFSQVCFPVGYVWEDTIIAGIIFKLAKKFVTLPNEVYFYRRNPHGLSRTAVHDTRGIDSLFVCLFILEAYEHFNWSFEAIKRGILWNLGQHLYVRIKYLEDKYQRAVFVIAAENIIKYGLIPEKPSDIFFENEIHQAFLNFQFERWKNAAQLI